MKPLAILDSSVVVSGIGWRRGDARAVLRLLAARGFTSLRTAELTEEWTDVVERVAGAERRWKNPNWASWLDWLKRTSFLVDSLPFKPTVRRDPKDDLVIAAGVSGNAGFIVTKDPDLLDLQKPFGIQCVTPRAFLSAVIRRG